MTTTRVALSLTEQSAERWTKLKEKLDLSTSGLAKHLIRQEWERLFGKQEAEKIKRGVGRPADSAAAKSAKKYVRRKIQHFQELKDEKRTLPNFEMAREAMQALMDAQLWERATEYMQSNWWSHGRETPEPDWQGWLKESEAE